MLFCDSSKKHSDEMPSARKAQYDPKQQLHTVDVDADQVIYRATAHVIMRDTVLLTVN